MRTILHFAQDGDTSGFFPQLARWHDRDRYRMLFGTLRTMAPWLREYMESQGVSCLSCGAGSKAGYPIALLRLRKFLRAQRVDVLHTHLFEPSVVGLSAAVAARTPFRVMTRHYSDYHTRIGKRWHVAADRACNRMSDAIIAVSQHTAEHLIQAEGAPPAIVHVVWNGIDFDRVKTTPEAQARVRRELVPEGEALLVSVGRLHPEKGYDVLFRAIAAMRVRMGRTFVHAVAGAGPFEGEYRELVRALGCEDVVRFLGFRRDAPDLIAAADLFVLASQAEAFGLAFAEAVYLGTPVVATRVGGIPEVVTDGVDGVLVEARDEKALADRMEELLVHPERRARLAGAGRESVVRRFAFPDMMRKYEKLYEELFDRAPQGRNA